jgi:hypothetical protein
LLKLNFILPEYVSVQIYSGNINEKQALNSLSAKEVYLLAKEDDNYIFESKILIDSVGKCGYTLRVLPQYRGEVQYMPEIIKWL